jgi:DNA-binding FadR family transcriptional regulator
MNAPVTLPDGGSAPAPDTASPGEFRIEKPGKLSAVIAGRIRREIVTGTLSSDDQLPPAPELARRFGVGRATVREALRVREAEGLISIMQGASGARVNRPDAGNLSRQMGYLMQLSSATLQEIFQTRRDLEALVAASIARTNSAAFVADAHAIFARVTEGLRRGRPDDCEEALAGFQVALRRHAPNQVLGWLVELVGNMSFREQVAESRRKATDTQTRLSFYKWALTSRTRLVDLIERGEGEEAARFWHEYMDEAIVRLGSDARLFAELR